MKSTVYMIAQKPRIEVKAKAERFLMSDMGRRKAAAMTIMLDLRPFQASGKPAIPRRGVKESPIVAEEADETINEDERCWMS
jgi:hypothetical protein